jgi:dTDP-4-dehydrorhamnose reductase
MKKIAITGSRGCLGHRIVNLGAVSLLCDVTDKREVERELNRVRPDVIIHAAAISSAEECDKSYEKAVQVNIRGTNIVCEVASDVIGDGKIVLISSDQVFDGVKGDYKENDEPNPIQLYDNKILRISRCFDSNSRDIAEYLLRLENNVEIEVPDFITRSYCHMDFMAEMIWMYAQQFDQMPEILHLGGSRSLSYYHFMRVIGDEFEHDPELIVPRGPSLKFSPRPHRCGLNVSQAKKIGFPLPSAIESIQRLKCETKTPS